MSDEHNGLLGAQVALLAGERDAFAQQLKAAQAKIVDWRPIETAPRGTLILVSKGGVPGVGRMGTVTRHDGSTVESFLLFPSNLPWNPKHWQPLPADPTNNPSQSESVK